MERMEKQTAVEWLVDEIEKHYITNNGVLDPTVVMPLKRQAKEMEKEQHLKTWTEGLYCETGDRQAFEQYYKETFK
jgi:hypothetical protein